MLDPIGEMVRPVSELGVHSDRTIGNVEVAHPPRTSLPVWPTEIPPIDQRATTYTLFSLGSDGEAVDYWRRELEGRGIPFDIVRVDRDSLDDWLRDLAVWFPYHAATRYVGWRLAAAGEEYAVLAVGAAATAAGLLACEYTAHVASADRAFVYCPHCKGTTLTADRSRGTITCQGCGRLLALHDHLSRRSGSYLGCVPLEQAEGGESGSDGLTSNETRGGADV